MIYGDLKDLEIHDGGGSDTKTIWRSVDMEIWKSGVWRYDDPGSTKGLALLPIRSGDLEIWGLGSRDPPRGWLRYHGDLEICRSTKGLAPTPVRSGDL